MNDRPPAVVPATIAAAALLAGCAVVGVAGTVAGAAVAIGGAAVTAGGAVVGSTVKAAGKVVEKTIDIAAPGGAAAPK